MNAHTRIIVGAEARELLADPAFLEGWAALHRACSWATPYQAPGFVSAWFDVYTEREPVVVLSGRPSGSMDSLWVLARSHDGNDLAVAGTHHAEYQAWLTATPEDAGRFFVDALDHLDRELGSFALELRYLPQGFPIAQLEPLLAAQSRIVLEAHPRPLWRLDSDAIAQSARKKSNKSRVNRVKRLGDFSFEQVRGEHNLRIALARIAPYYDIRQGVENGAFPFSNDPRKLEFHARLMAEHPELLHVTIISIDRDPISMHIGFCGTHDVHLAIIAHSPMIAKLSPGKIHLLLLAQQLVDEGWAHLDLTPGGDPWKERFANAHDSVHVLTVHRSGAGRRLASYKRVARRAAMQALRSVGCSPGTIARFTQRSRRSDSTASTPRDAGRVVECIVRGHSGESGRWNVARNSVDHLLRADSRLVGSDRQAFLGEALTRLEAGEHVCTVSDDKRVLAIAWHCDNAFAETAAEGDRALCDLKVADEVLDQTEEIIAAVCGIDSSNAGTPVRVRCSEHDSLLRERLDELATPRWSPDVDSVTASVG